MTRVNIIFTTAFLTLIVIGCLLLDYLIRSVMDQARPKP